MSDQKMREIKGRITISRYAKKETLKKPQGFETRWYLWITQLYSGVRYFEGEFKKEPVGSKEMYSVRYIYDSEKTIHPIHTSSFPRNPERGAKIFTDWKFYIAVKELIIEWEDYQAEIAGYIHCNARGDLIHQSEWFKKWLDSENSDNENVGRHKYETPNDAKQLLRFVKSPGLKTTDIKIQKEDLEFFPIKLKQCETEMEILEEIVVGKSLQVRREHQLDCEIRPLFDKKQPLPIKYAHITVEIYLQ